MICCILASIILTTLIWPVQLLRPKAGQIRNQALSWRMASNEKPIQHSSKFSIAARARSFRYALEGLIHVVCNEHNARIHLFITFCVLITGLLLKITPEDWQMLLFAIVSVWFAETMNTAFEYLCDVVSPDKSESVRHAKDIAAGAVLIVALGAALIGYLVLVPYLDS